MTVASPARSDTGDTLVFRTRSLWTVEDLMSLLEATRSLTGLAHELGGREWRPSAEDSHVLLERGATFRRHDDPTRIVRWCQFVYDSRLQSLLGVSPILRVRSVHMASPGWIHLEGFSPTAFLAEAREWIKDFWYRNKSEKLRMQLDISRQESEFAYERQVRELKLRRAARRDVLEQLALNDELARRLNHGVPRPEPELPDQQFVSEAAASMLIGNERLLDFVVSGQLDGSPDALVLLPDPDEDGAS